MARSLGISQRALEERELLAFQSLADEWAMVVAEAMAFALPILGSVFSQAVEELVTKGEMGWTFPADKPEEVKSALHRVLTDSTQEADRCGLAASQQQGAGEGR